MFNSILYAISAFAMLLSPSLSYATPCLEAVPGKRGPVHAYAQCTSPDTQVRLYIDGVSNDSSAYGTIDKTIYTLGHGTHTCEVKCYSTADGWHSESTGSFFVDRSSTSTATASFAQGTCGTLKVEGTATFSDYPAGWTVGTIDILVDGGTSIYKQTCYTSPCSYSYARINAYEGPHTIQIKTADSLIGAGGGTVTSSVPVTAAWPVTITPISPIGTASRCERVKATASFCYDWQSGGTGYIYAYYDTTANPYYARMSPCYTSPCTLDAAVTLNVAGGPHTLIIEAWSPYGNKYSETRAFTTDEVPMAFIEPSGGNNGLPASSCSLQGKTNGKNKIPIKLSNGMIVYYDSLVQFSTRSVLCPAALYKQQFGEGISHGFGYGLFKNPSGNMIMMGGGISPKMYTLSGGVYVAQADDSSVLTKNANGTYKITSRDGTVENFSTTGALTSIIDRYSNTTTVSAIANHQQTVTDPTGKVTVFNFDTTDEKVNTITDPAGSVTNFQYDTVKGTLSKIQEPAPASGEPRPEWNFQYDSSNLIISMTDPEGNTTYYGNDADNKITSITDPEGFAKSFVYNTGTTAVTDKNGGVWTYDYDTTTKLITATTDPLGNKTLRTYGTNNKVATESVPMEGPSATPTTRYVHAYQYDANKNLTDDTGYAVRYTYDSNGNVLTQTNDAVSFHVGYTYDAANYDQVTSVTNYMDSPATTTTLVHDTNGGYKRTTVTDPEGAVTVIRKNTDGTPHDVTYGNGATQVYAYNANKTLLSVTGADGVKLQVDSYDSAGNPKVVKAFDSTGTLRKTTNLDYDKLNRPKQSAVVGSQFNYTNQAGYNKSSDTTLAIDAEGNPTSFAYNFRGQTTTTTDALSKSTVLEYGANSSPTCGGVDQLTALTDANGNRSTWEYDAAGRLEKETDALGNAIRYEYYPSGLVWKKIKDTGNDVIATYTYDALGNVTGIAYLDGGWEAYTYYPGGQLLTAGNQNITYTFEWYRNGQLKKVTDSNGKVVDYNSYNGAGQRTLVTLLAGTADQKILTYGYGTSGNSNGKLTSIAETGVGTFGFGYDDLGRRSTLTYPNGIVGTYSFHAEQPEWLAGIAYQGTLPITSVSYPTFDKTGNRLGKTIDGTAVTFQYDVVYRLLNTYGGISESFTYDDAGNRLTEAGQSYTIASANRLMAKPGKTFSYDYFGNTTTDGEWTYSWNSKNELVQMSKAGTVVSFGYDVFGRRVSKTAVVSGVTTTHQYVYDKEDIVLEYVNGVLTSHFVHGPGIDEPLALVRSGGTGAGNYFYHADGLGSVLKLTDSAQNVVQSYSYDSFGEVTAVGSIEQPYAYTGREYDPETGKYYYRLRYYDADSGRFLSRDPMSFAAGDAVLTNYVGGNPVNYIDPSGNIPFPIITAGIGAVAGFSGSIIGQLLSNGWNYKCLKMKNAIIAGGVGAVAGLAAPSLAKTYFGAMGLGGISNSIQYGITQYFNHDEISGNGFLLNFSTGVLGGVVGGKITQANIIWDTSGKFGAGTAIAKALNQEAQIKRNTGMINFIRNILGSVTGNVEF